MYTIFNKITSRTISFKVTLSNLKKDFNAKEIMLLIHILLIFNKPILQLNFIIYDHIFLRHGKIKIMSATSAFGMGINVSDVTLVIHTTFPLSHEQYIQEIGRAGRLGQGSKAIMFYSRGDIRTLLAIISNGQER